MPLTTGFGHQLANSIVDERNTVVRRPPSSQNGRTVSHAWPLPTGNHWEFDGTAIQWNTEGAHMAPLADVSNCSSAHSRRRPFIREIDPRKMSGLDRTLAEERSLPAGSSCVSSHA